MSNISYGNSLFTAGQFALDGKLRVNTTVELTANISINAFRYYEDMVVHSIENHIEYIWKERVSIQEIGLLSSDFVYPNNSISNGIDYSNRAFNFFIKQEIDPAFKASEAYKFVTGDKVKLDSAVQPSSLGAAAFSNDYNDLDNLPIIPPASPVTSVNGKAGAINLTTTDIPEGTNLYYTENRVSNNSNVLQNTAKRSYPVTDEARLAGTSGVNTGDESNISIKTKRPLKTIEGQSLEGSGNIDLDKYTQQEVDDLLRPKSFYNTGLIQFGELIVNNPNVDTTFDINMGFAGFMDWDGTLALPKTVLVAFPSMTGITPQFLATSPTSYIGLEYDFDTEVVSVIQKATPFTNEERRTIVELGVIVHTDNTVIVTSNNISAPLYQTTNQLHDLMEAIGALNLSGNDYSPNGANLQIDRSAGIVFKRGTGAFNNYEDPHRLTLPVDIGSTFRYRLSDSTEFVDTNVIDPDNFESPLGGLTSVPNNDWQIQRITVFQSGITRIQYGQETYANLEDAEIALGSEKFVTEQNIAENGIFRCFLIVKEGATNLSNPAQAKFINTTKFGNTITRAGGAVTSANIIAALGYTPENVANKTTNFVVVDNTLYPTTQAVVNYINSLKAQPNQLATLDTDGKLISNQIPDIAITSVISAVENDLATFVVNNGNYTYEQGDVIVIDDGIGNITHYMYKGGVKTDTNEYSEINASQISISQVSGLQTALDSKANSSDVYTKTESENRYVNVTGDTMTGDLISTGQFRPAALFTPYFFHQSLDDTSNTAKHFWRSQSGSTRFLWELESLSRLSLSYIGTSKRLDITSKGVELYHLGNLKLSTTTDGATTAGTHLADFFIGNGSGLIDVDAVTLNGRSDYFNPNRLNGVSVVSVDADTYFDDKKGGFVSSYNTLNWLTNGAFEKFGGLLSFRGTDVSNFNNLQLQYSNGHGTTDGGRLAFRTKNNTNFTTWKELYHTGNFTPSDYLPLIGGTLTGNLTASNITASNQLKVSGTLANKLILERTDSNANISLLFKGNTLDRYLGVNNGDLYFSETTGIGTGGLIWHSNNLTPSDYLKLDSAGTKTAGALVFNTSVPLIFGTNSNNRFNIFHNGGNLLFNSNLGDFVFTDNLTPKVSIRRTTGNIEATGDVSANTFTENGVTLSDKYLNKTTGGTITGTTLYDKTIAEQESANIKTVVNREFVEDYVANNAGSGLPVGFYEEGTFTPTIIDDGGGAAYNAGTTTANFTRIGNIVNFTVIFENINTTGTPTGTLTINGLPEDQVFDGTSHFTIKTLKGSDVSSVNLDRAVMEWFGLKQIALYNYTNALSITGVTFTGGDFRVSGTYKTNVYTP